MTTPAILYARFSPRPDAEECDSCAKQLERCRAYCAGQAKPYQVLAEYHDEDKSGARADNRPDLQAALDHVCEARGVLVVYSLDRLARNTREAIEILERIREAGADLASLTESLNTRSAIGQFLFELLAAFAQLQRRQISERTGGAMRQYQANGRRMTRPDRCPLGQQPDVAGPWLIRYKVAGQEVRHVVPAEAAAGLVEKLKGDGIDAKGMPARLCDHPDEQAAIVRIRQLAGDGLGPKAIAGQLDAEGIPCRGRQWAASTVRRVLRREGRSNGQS